MVFGESVSFMAWQRIGSKIHLLGNASTWWIADWLVFGQRKHETRYRAAVETIGLDYQTLRNYAYVARKFPLSRRRDNLSFQHHAEVAPLPEDEQDRWLDLAEEYSWSRNELRRRLRLEALASGPAADIVPTVVIRVRARYEQESRWREAAKRQEADLDDWIVEILDTAAARSEGRRSQSSS